MPYNEDSEIASTTLTPPDTLKNGGVVCMELPPPEPLQDNDRLDL